MNTRTQEKLLKAANISYQLLRLNYLVRVGVSVEDVQKRALSKKFLKVIERLTPPGTDVQATAQEVMTLIIQRLESERTTAGEDVPVTIARKNIGLALQWIVSQVQKGELNPFAITQGQTPIYRNLAHYFYVVNFVPADKRNLMNVAPRELSTAVAEGFEAKQEKEANDKIKKLKNKSEYEKVLSTEKYDVYIPHNQEAACFLGLQTKWCTSALSSDNAYSQYHTPDDPLFIFFDKKNKTKYQVHFGSNQFMDAADDTVDGATHIELMSALEPLASRFSIIDKHVVKDAQGNISYLLGNVDDPDAHISLYGFHDSKEISYAGILYDDGKHEFSFFGRIEHTLKRSGLFDDDISSILYVQAPNDYILESGKELVISLGSTGVVEISPAAGKAVFRKLEGENSVIYALESPVVSQLGPQLADWLNDNSSHDFWGDLKADRLFILLTEMCKAFSGMTFSS